MSTSKTCDWFPYWEKNGHRISCHRRIGHQSMCQKVVVQTLNGLHSLFHYFSTSYSISFICSSKRTTELRKFISKINKTNILYSVRKCVYVSKVPIADNFRPEKKMKNWKRMRYIFLRPVSCRSIFVRLSLKVTGKTLTLLVLIKSLNDGKRQP